MTARTDRVDVHEVLEVGVSFADTGQPPSHRKTTASLADNGDLWSATNAVTELRPVLVTWSFSTLDRVFSYRLLEGFKCFVGRTWTRNFVFN